MGAPPPPPLSQTMSYKSKLYLNGSEFRVHYLLCYASRVSSQIFGQILVILTVYTTACLMHECVILGYFNTFPHYVKRQVCWK